MYGTFKSPLITTGMQFTAEVCPDITEESRQIIESTLRMFLNSNISYKEASQVFLQVLSTRKPLNRLYRILQIPEAPIPDALGAKYNKWKSHHWTAYEDNRLLVGIHRYGFDNWTAIAKFVGNGRTRAHCAQRWARGLNPVIRKDKWTHEEDQKLVELVSTAKFRSWTGIAARMGNRSDVQCRYHYKQLMEEKGKANCISPSSSSTTVSPSSSTASTDIASSCSPNTSSSSDMSDSENGISQSESGVFNPLSSSKKVFLPSINEILLESESSIISCCWNDGFKLPIWT